MIALVGVLLLSLYLIATLAYYLYATRDDPIHGSIAVPRITGNTTTTGIADHTAIAIPVRATLPHRSLKLRKGPLPGIDEAVPSFAVGVYGEPSLYGYSNELLTSMDPRTRQMAIDQIRIDMVNFNSVPRLASAMELVPAVGGGLTSHVLGNSIASGKESSIFRVDNHPKRVIKYQSNCFEGRGNVHPLLRDYWFQSLLTGLNLAAEVYFVSPPIKFEIHPSTKTQFELGMDERIQCAASPDVSIRYMVMEEALISTADWMHRFHDARQWTPFRQTIRILRNAISGLQRMHDQGIIHGDVHYGNVAFFERDGVQSQGFIDFGRAFFANETAGTPAVKYMHRGYGYECLHTVYSLYGYRASFRDDVFGAVLMTAFLLNGRRYVRYCMSLEADPDAMFAFKADDFLFNYPGGPDRVKMLNVSAADKAAITADLGLILDAARSVNHIDARPPYSIILAAADRILVRTTD